MSVPQAQGSLTGWETKPGAHVIELCGFGEVILTSCTSVSSYVKQELKYHIASKYGLLWRINEWIYVKLLRRMPGT